MISSVETLSSNGCRTRTSGGGAVRSSWAVMRPGSAVRTRIPPSSRIRSPSRDNDSPYLVVGQWPAGLLRDTQDTVHEVTVDTTVDAIHRKPVPHVARARRAVD